MQKRIDLEKIDAAVEIIPSRNLISVFFKGFVSRYFFTIFEVIASLCVLPERNYKSLVPSAFE